MASLLCEKLQSFEKDGLKNELGTCPSVIIFDEITEISQEDCTLVNILFRQFYNSRVLLFLLTAPQRKLPISFCGMNGKQRIKPLEGTYGVEDGHEDWESINKTGHPFTCNMAVHIKWSKSNWNRCKLSKLVHLRYPDFDFSKHGEKTVEGGTSGKAYDFIVEGDLPDDAFYKKGSQTHPQCKPERSWL